MTHCCTNNIQSLIEHKNTLTYGQRVRLIDVGILSYDWTKIQTFLTFSRSTELN